MMLRKYAQPSFEELPVERVNGFQRIVHFPACINQDIHVLARPDDPKEIRPQQVCPKLTLTLYNHKEKESWKVETIVQNIQILQSLARPICSNSICILVGWFGK